MRVAALMLLVCVAVAGEPAPGVASAAQPPSLTAVLDTYLQGRYDDAVQQAARLSDLAPFRLRWVQDVPLWIRSDLSQVEPRRAAAAAFLLELTHARLESDWGRLADLIEFICVDLRGGRPEPAFERAWYRASLALAGRARARAWLLGDYAVLPHQTARRRPPGSKPDPNPRHLMHALDRFADDPVLQLDRIVAWSWGRDQEPMRNLRVRDDESTPIIRRVAPQREAIVALEALVSDATVGSDALMRIAQLQLTLDNPSAAMAAANRAAAVASSTEVAYTARLLAGRALEALDRAPEAAEKYRAALELIPGAESATIALASIQFVHDEREAALDAVARTLDRADTAIDPGRLIGFGSFMHWLKLRADLRAALRP